MRKRQIEINKPTYLTLQEASDVLRLGKRTVAKYITNGDLKATKLSFKNIIIKKDDLENFIKERQIWAITQKKKKKRK